MFTSEDIHNATGIPLDNIQANWPAIADALGELGYTDDNKKLIGLIATIAVETNVGNQGFYPIIEIGSHAYFEEHYGYNTKTGKQLGNTAIGDGADYCGRGYIQITGKGAYIDAAKYLDIDCVNNPSLLLEPINAIKLTLKCFDDKKVWAACDEQNWSLVRKKVNGGSNGIDKFLTYVNNLLALC